MLRLARLPLELLLLGALFAGLSVGQGIYANIAADASARTEIAHKVLWPGELRDRIIPSGHYQACETDERGFVTVWCYR